MPIVTDQTKAKATQSSSTADLFRILRAMAADPDVRELDFRVAFVLVNAVNARTGWAEISDEKLTLKASVSGQQARRARRSLEAAGWLRTVKGRRGVGTRYLFLEAKAEDIEARLKAQIQAIDDRRTVEEIERQAGLAAEALAFNIDRETGEISVESEEGFPFKSDTVSPSQMIPILPQGSTSPVSLPMQDETQEEAKPKPCSECGKPSVGKADCFEHAYCAAHIWMAT